MMPGTPERITHDYIRAGTVDLFDALEADIRAWVKVWNEDPKPFIWTKTAEQFLTSIGRLMQRVARDTSNASRFSPDSQKHGFTQPTHSPVAIPGRCGPGRRVPGSGPSSRGCRPMGPRSRRRARVPSIEQPLGHAGL